MVPGLLFPRRSSDRADSRIPRTEEAPEKGIIILRRRRK
jgi:hypothetical protein